MSQGAAAADGDIAGQVQDELNWAPDVDSGRVAVSIADGILTLSGAVATHAEKLAAERCALRVRGVRSVRDELSVDAPPADDPAIREAVRQSLEWHTAFTTPIHVDVTDGHVVLTGDVPWDHQRQAAEHIAANVSGVRSVDNRIELTRRPSAADTAERIHNALLRQALLATRSIRVETDGTRVILHGRVASWLERAHAAKAAWASPHVTDVDNRIVVEGER